MLTLYRRHKATCPEFSKGRNSHNRCKCKIWADGVLGGKETRQAVGTSRTKRGHLIGERDWTKAQKIVREWEASEKITEQSAAITLADAWTALLADLKTRVSSETIRKYKTLEKQMTAWATERGLTLLSQFDLDTLCQFRQVWTDGRRTSKKKVERLRALFSFAIARKWVTENPAKAIKLPKDSLCPTMPLTPADWLKLLTACDGSQLSSQPSARLGAHRLKSLILLMRYTGLRISDAVSFTTDRLDGKKVFLYTAKTGVPVSTILPDFVLRELEATPRVTEKNYFWSGNGKRETAVCDWQGKIKDVFDLAGISKGMGNAVSHRLRDTFAVALLLAGVPLERVAVLLGNSVKVCEKHYSPWTRSRQEQIESDLNAAWNQDDFLAKQAGTERVQIKSVRPN